MQRQTAMMDEDLKEGCKHAYRNSCSYGTAADAPVPAGCQRQVAARVMMWSSHDELLALAQRYYAPEAEAEAEEGA